MTIIDMQGGYYKASLFNPASQKIFSKGGTGDSQSSGWEGGRNILSPGGAFRPWRDRIGGKTLESGAVARIPQNTRPRPPFGKPNPGSDPGNPRIFRPGPMKELTPYYVLPWAERTPWARPNRPRAGSECRGRWKIHPSRPLDWEKTLISFFLPKCSFLLLAGCRPRTCGEESGRCW